MLLAMLAASCEKKQETTLASGTKLTSIVFAKDTSNVGISKASFTVDFNTGTDTALVYNEDSLACGTRIDSVVATFYFSTNIGYAMFRSDSTEKLVSASDTLNFTARPCVLRVVSEDQAHEQYYHIYVNVHTMDPDLYVWEQPKDDLFDGHRDVHAENFHGQVHLYTQDGVGVRLFRSTNGTVWGPQLTPTGLPKTADVRRIIHSKNYLLYTQDNILYTTSDGQAWSATDCSGTGLTLVNLLFWYNDSIWSIAKDAAGDLVFATWNEGGLPKVNSQIGPIKQYFRTSSDQFPVSDYSALTYVGKSGRLRAMIMGGYDEMGMALNTRWNLEWVDTDDFEGVYHLENFTIEQPEFERIVGAAVVWYDDRLLLFGSANADNVVDDNPILESIDEGMNWIIPDSTHNMLPPTYTSRCRQTAVITDDWAILLIGGQNRTTSYADVWRGKKNSIDWWWEY